MSARTLAPALRRAQCGEPDLRRYPFNAFAAQAMWSATMVWMKK